MPAWHRLLTRTIDWEDHRIALVLGIAAPDVEQLYAGTVADLKRFYPYVGPGSPSGGHQLVGKSIERILGARRIRYRAYDVTFTGLGPQPNAGEVFPSRRDKIAGYLVVAPQGSNPRNAVPISWMGGSGFPIETTGGNLTIQCGLRGGLLELGL